jgi:hypothetical protein
MNREGKDREVKMDARKRNKTRRQVRSQHVLHQPNLLRGALLQLCMYNSVCPLTTPLKFLTFDSLRQLFLNFPFVGGNFYF